MLSMENLVQVGAGSAVGLRFSKIQTTHIVFRSSTHSLGGAHDFQGPLGLVYRDGSWLKRD